MAKATKTTKVTLETVTPSLGRRLHTFFGLDAVKTAARYEALWISLGYSVRRV